MHSAPSVSYPSGRSRFAAVLLLLALLLGATVASFWWYQSQTPGWRIGAAWAVLAAAGAFASWHWLRGAQGTLAWDGETWTWTWSAGGVEEAGVLEVGIDLQDWLLVRWTSGGRSHWLWLEGASRAERWDDLRRAVYSRARPEALPGARPPAAKP